MVLRKDPGQVIQWIAAFASSRERGMLHKSVERYRCGRPIVCPWWQSRCSAFCSCGPLGRMCTSACRQSTSLVGGCDRRLFAWICGRYAGGGLLDLSAGTASSGRGIRGERLLGTRRLGKCKVTRMGGLGVEEVVAAAARGGGLRGAPRCCEGSA